ncbi:hypothetical protein V1498_09820 [Peribacillus sp. SCS-26]
MLVILLVITGIAGIRMSGKQARDSIKDRNEDSLRAYSIFSKGSDS